MVDSITPQYGKNIYMVDKGSKIQLDDLNSKHHGGKSIRDLIDHAIGVRFYTPPRSEHYKLIRLNRFHGLTHSQVKSHDKTH